MKQYIYGKNTIIEALQGDVKIAMVYLLASTKDHKIAKLCQTRDIPVKIVEKSFFIEAIGDVVHQGVMASIASYNYYDIDAILHTIPEGKKPLLVMLDGLEDPHNLGAILRSCDALGVDGVIIGKNRSVSLNGTVAKVSTGAIEYVKVAKVTNLSRTLDTLKDKGFWVVGCDVDTKTIDYRQQDYNMPLVIVIGSEGSGISRLVRKNCDICVTLPMIGHVSSLNASVATAVLLYQVYNSRHPLK